MYSGQYVLPTEPCDHDVVVPYCYGYMNRYCGCYP